VVYVFAVEHGKGFKGGGEDLGLESDFEFGRCEGVYASDSGFVERDGEALPDFAFPEEFEDLVGWGESVKIAAAAVPCSFITRS